MNRLSSVSKKSGAVQLSFGANHPVGVVFMV